MRTLPLDERGYPVPWFVSWVDGKPEFRTIDPHKFRRAIKEKLCWVCGLQLGVYKCFAAGPMCGINRTSSEPPSHSQCAYWSAMNCPFLSNPKMVRREDNLPKDYKDPAGFGLSRNPGVVMLWTTRTYDVFKVDNGYLIQMGEPESVEWIRESRQATKAEVEESINTGIPALEAIARTEEGGLKALQEARQRFEKYLPR